MRNILISRPLRLCPTHFTLHLLQQLGQQLVDRFECLAVTLLCEGQVVKHIVVGDGAVNLTADENKTSRKNRTKFNPIQVVIQ